MTERAKKIHTRLSGRALVTVNDLMDEFGIGRGAAFRYLKKEKSLTSVNFKGQYHIKRSGLKFNRYGLVTVNEKVFSRHGNLTETVLQLVNQSPAGMPVAELNRLTATQTHMQCTKLHKEGQVFRRKFHGQFHYFAIDETVRESQLNRRNPPKQPLDLDTVVEAESAESLSDVVKVLVTHVNNPEYSPKSISLSLTRRGNDIKTEEVKGIFERYGIAKKKP
jgi:hypothetical protein